MDYAQLRLDWMRQRAELASARVNMQRTEADYRRLILEEYTFLKRPVFWVGDSLFVGNAPKTIAALKAAIATHEAQNKAS